MSTNSIINNNYSCSFENFEFQYFDFLPKDLLASSESDDELPDFNLFGESIHHDCKILESNNWTPSSLTPGDHFEAICNENDSEKYEIRNHDCMWSGRCKTDYEKNKLAAKNQQITQQQQQQTKSTTVVAQTVESIKQTTIAVPPATVQTATIQQQPMPQQQSKSVIQNIPPGTSLLINSRTKQMQQTVQHQQEQQRRQQQQQQQQLKGHQSQCKVTIPTVMTNDFLKDRMIQIRPDSPLSLDDDPPEFKHSVDLTACIMGSNNICLDTSTTSSSLLLQQQQQQQANNDIEKLLRIRMLREQLEDTSGKMIFNDNGKITGCGDISDGPTDLSDVLNVLKAEVDDKSDDMDSDSGESMASSNEEEEEEEEEYHSKSHSPSSGYGSNSPEYTSSVIHHSDHSYTRSKNGVDLSGLGLETPSDSDEEIDVVSVGDKKLPTNPSDKDRRALQTKVANRITARIVKTPAGIKTIPPRRRCSLEPYGSTTLSPAKSPLSSSYYNSSSSASSTTSNKYSTSSSRKRHYISSTSKDDYVPSNKRSRGSKKQRSSGNKRHNANTSSNNNSHSNSNTTNNCNYDPDEADTIEKRNLHNDMERQRRIGLKNLFEALKRQIPSIKDKERAPKVNILREAAKLCEQFTREEKQMNAMKQQLQIQMQRRQAQLRSLKQQALQRAGGGKSLA